MLQTTDLLFPDWPAPARVRALVSTRAGGISPPPYASLNLGAHVGDDPACVVENRRRLQAFAGCEPVWLDQVHSTRVVEADPHRLQRADASWTRVDQRGCVVLTADCLPVLFCDREGHQVAAAHAGWRGLQAGILEQTVASFAEPAAMLLAWLGPAIGPAAYEVGPEVRSAFMAEDPDAASCFRAVSGSDRWLADLYGLARRRLARIGVTAVFGGGCCTLSESRFYSYRQSAVTGRQASMIWLASRN